MQLLQKIYLIIFMATAISSVITPVGITYAQSTVVPGGEETGGTQSPTNVAESMVVPASASPAPKGVYTSLVNLPGLTDNTNRTLAEYVNVLFRLAIGIGALIAVVKIIVAGIKYMASDAVFSKEEAKKDIQNALLGLLIMLSTVVILRLINKDLLNIDVFQALQPLKGVELTPTAVPRPTEFVESTPTEEQLQKASSSGTTILFTGGLTGQTSQQGRAVSNINKECLCKGGVLRNVQTTEGTVIQCEKPKVVTTPKPAGCI